jgi:hypothetical protein
LRNFTEETVCRAEKTLAWFFTVLICLWRSLAEGKL